MAWRKNNDQWFYWRAWQLFKDLCQNENFKASDKWFLSFTNRFKISFCRKSHCAQKDPQSLRYSIVKFHSKMLHIRRFATYQMNDILNMDQTPFPFVIDNGKRYAKKGSSKVWCATHGSGLTKRQCSVQVTIFADGKPRVKPLVIF